MKPKLLACDVDGTLIQHSNQTITDKDIQAIKKFREQGHLFVLCTGRTLTWTEPLLRHYNIQTDALILCNGSMIYSVNPNNPIDITLSDKITIPNKIALEIMKYAYYQLDNFVIYWDDGEKTYEIQDRLMESVEFSSVVQEELSNHMSIEDALKLTSDFATLGIAPMSKDINETKKAQEHILKTWNISSARNQFFIDITPLNSSKGVGLCKFVGQKDLELHAVGDSLNDLSMFEVVGKDNAFWIKSGSPELRSEATHHVNTVAECIDIILSQG